MLPQSDSPFSRYCLTLSPLSGLGSPPVPMDLEDNPQPVPMTASVKCRCKRSQCLKLYCDCFVAMGYCRDCGCIDCLNTPGTESQRREAIQQLLSRDSQAFRRPEKLASKGCNCKRSGCSKKYCECFYHGLACGEACRCEGCQNTKS
jgi:hypothetical protein